MRRCRIVTWILILSIVNFALGAPAAVREGLEMSVDVDVAEGGTATSQKRYDPLDSDAWSTTNAADRPLTPPSPTPSEVDRLRQEVAEQDLDFLCAENPEECFGPIDSESEGSNEPNYTPSNPGLSTGSHPGPTGGSPLPPLPRPGPSEVRFPSSPGFSGNPDTMSSTGHQLTPPQSPTGDSPLPLPHPGPSKGRFPSPPGFSVNPDMSSTGHQPTPPQSPTGDSPLPPLPHPGPSGSPHGYLDDVLKDKIKRRISGSGAMDSAQRDPRSTNI
jgi:hypothetical protein